MGKNPLKNLIIRTGIVRLPDFSFILACDPKKEKNGIAHMGIFAWDKVYCINNF